MKNRITYIFILLFLAAAFMTDSPPPGWYQQSIPIGNKLIKDIQFLDSLNGWVITSWGPAYDTAYVFKTSNGGNNWDFQYRFHGSFLTIQMTDYNTGYICGSTGSGKIWKTTNSGVNWFIQTSFSLNPINDIFFVNRDTGWACTTDGFGPGVFKTTNGGMSWQYQLTGVTAQKLFFINQDTGWAISSDNKIYRTTSSGVNWTMQHDFSSEDLVDVFFTSKDTGWIHGGSTGLFKTTNSGVNWDTVSTPFGYGIGNIYFTDSKHGWIGRSFSRILVTTNGSTWGYQNTPSGNHYAVYFTDTLKGWAGGDNLIHTTDGGGPITYIGIKPSSTFVTAFELKQNYPNPFNPSTTIEFYVQKPSRISLKIYTIEGREAGELLDYEKFDAGYTYYAEFNSGSLSSGVYLYQMTGWTLDKKEIFIDTKKMILIK